jgi:hypothetical protein
MAGRERDGDTVTPGRLRQLFSLRGSIAARLAVGYGLLVAASVAALSAIFYVGTVGVFEHSIDNKIQGIATRMEADYRTEGMAALERRVEEQLHDRTDSDTEIMGLVDADGRSRIGNLPPRLPDLPPPGQLALATLQRGGSSDTGTTRAEAAPVPVSVRLMTVPLERGVRLVVGRDLSELDAIRSVIERALVLSGAVSMLLMSAPSCSGASSKRASATSAARPRASPPASFPAASTCMAATNSRAWAPTSTACWTASRR